MDKYIKCDERLIDRVMYTCSSSALAAIKTKELLENYPASDVTEVKRGHWEWKELYGEVGYMLVCSECEESEGACERYTYCPNCGAKMDEK